MSHIHCPICNAWVEVDQDGEIEYHTVWARRYAIAEVCRASFRKPADIEAELAPERES